MIGLCIDWTTVDRSSVGAEVSTVSPIEVGVAPQVSWPNIIKDALAHWRGRGARITAQEYTEGEQAYG